jgi:hypothetical protein
MTLRRSNRSAAGPANGDAKNTGRLCTTNTSAVSRSEPDSSRTNPSRATVANQSPAYDTTCAIHNVRKSRLRRSTSSTRRT